MADDDGLFAAAGNRLASVVSGDLALFAGATFLVSLVTTVLNLDTSVAFLTPVFVHVARARRSDDAALLYGCLLLSNSASLLLPGSNLTNLIVLGHLHLSGARFAGRMALAFVASVTVTSLVVAVSHRRGRRAGGLRPGSSDTRSGGPDDSATSGLRGRRADLLPLPHPPLRPLGFLAVAAATVVVLLVRSPALPVAAVGCGAVAVKLLQRRTDFERVARVLGARVLVGLLGVAVALGTLGRSWNGPATLLEHLGSWATAGVAALASVLVNNLPAASLLSARVPPHPYSLLVGLNLGPNLFVTGSLSSLLWLSSARSAGARPSVGKVTRLGIVVVPLSMIAAIGALSVTGGR